MISTPHRRSRAALVIAGCASLTACVVGSDYRAPPAVDTGGGWKRTVDQASAPAELARRWSTLGAPELDRLVDTALDARTSVALGKRVIVVVGIGRHRIIKKTKNTH